MSGDVGYKEASPVWVNSEQPERSWYRGKQPDPVNCAEDAKPGKDPPRLPAPNRSNAARSGANKQKDRSENNYYDLFADYQ